MNKIVVGFACLTMLASPACTTVEIASTQASQHVSASAVLARQAIQSSAKTLLYVFSKEKWSDDANASSNQSAASILLRGFKKTGASEDNTEAYIRQVISTRDVEDDILEAQKHVELITLNAQALLSEDPNLTNVKPELDVLEKALISSRQAEKTFAQAIKAKAYGNDDRSGRYLEAYKESVDGLKATTDAFGGMMRGDLATSATG